ncbi:MAG: excinuclease ABC subunit UvrA [Thermoanaerobaculia bacterium]|nr:excinuclease ABC subunit UvrA [Thermoanaerobaculia bacterium]
MREPPLASAPVVTPEPAGLAARRETAIEVVGARTHNLKGVSCRVPHGRLTVVTGPSGAGKSSLVFDTIYAEGQRRFVESMSTYARQFLDQMERPPVDDLRHILPAVALEAKNSVRNARSTVATITETHDVLRLLFAHLGEVGCPRGHGPARRFTAAEAAADLAAGTAGARFTLVARLPRPRRGADGKLAELVRQGFARRLTDGEVMPIEVGESWPKQVDPLPLVLGRFAADPASTARLAATIEDGWRLAGGALEAIGERTRFYAPELGCPDCGLALRPPSPALFSFNSPLGACPTCEGFGRVIGIDAERVVPDPGRSLAEHPIAPWNTPAYEELYGDLLVAAKKRKVPVDRPWSELRPADRDWVWRGEGDFVSVESFFRWLEARTYKVHVRVLLARYRAYNPCPDCGGARLNREARAVHLHGRTLPELAALSVEQLIAWLGGQEWSAREREVGGHLFAELGERLDVLHRVGLDYLTLDRQARTLSGGETQRIHLAAALGSGLTSTLYVLDEPTIGLHPQDSERLLALLADLAARGNTVLVVEHDRTLIEGADWLIDLGPAAGEQGGSLVAEGPPAEVLEHPESLTAHFLRDKPATPARAHVARFRREHGRKSVEQELADRPRLTILGAREHNLTGIDLDFPLDALVAVTGVSGSGKSTLIENVLYGTYQRSRGVVDVEPGRCDALLGIERLADVTLVDQSPIGRSSRSNPVTYVKAYDDLRRIFAGTEEARRRGITPAHFSFNLETGRCPECEGSGVLEVDMQFMAPVVVPCERCQGRRFRPEVLAVRHLGRDIAQTLELTVDEALVLLAREATFCRKLTPLAEVGLGYLRLGQPTSTLSGGEAQRLKLASFLGRSKRDGRRLFLFDEPTTGLHLSDIDLLYRTLRRLVQRGDGVVVVEHSLDLIAHADWIVDLGPGGGLHGGRLLHCGPLAPFLDDVDSPTAESLRRHLRWKRAPGGGSVRMPAVP